MADTNTGDGSGEEKHHADSFHDPLPKPNGVGGDAEARASTSPRCPVRATREYCEELRAWMWQSYAGYVTWQSWLAASALPCPYYVQPGSGVAATSPLVHSQNWYGQVAPTLLPHAAAATSQSIRPGEAAGGAGPPAQQQQVPRENGNPPRAGECCCCCHCTVGIAQLSVKCVKDVTSVISRQTPITEGLTED